ncbi:MAG: ferrous iron transport protein A [Christensenellaceae bacterium]|jgi:Fe2+ transport system protein FeoA|nr:ferrous iron transport protein A [Christensenellaceae bacterium]
MISLSEGKVGVPYMVVEIEGEPKVKRRLCDLGFLGATVKIDKISSLKGVYLIEIRGALLSLRARILKNIRVRV